MKSRIIAMKHSNNSRWVMLGYIFILQFSIACIARSVAPMAAVIGKDMQLTSVEIGYFPAALFLGQACISMPAGYLSDKIGTRKMLMLIISVLTSAFYLLAISTSLTLILVWIIIAGFAYGSSHPTTNRAIIDWFPVTKRGTAMGIKQMSVTLGSAIAAICLLPLGNEIGWQVTYIIVATIFVIVCSLLTVRYKERQVKTPQKNKENNVSFLNIKHLWTKSLLLTITATAFVLSGVQMILNTFIVIYALQYIQLSLVTAGLLLVIAEVGGSVGRIFWGIVSDIIFRGNRLIVMFLICILVFTMALIVALLPNDTPFIALALTIFLFGIGSNGFNGIWMNATTEVTSKKHAGIATGFSITVASLGAVCLPPIFGYALDKTNNFPTGWLYVSFSMIVPIVLIFVQLIIGIKGKIKK